MGAKELLPIKNFVILTIRDLRQRLDRTNGKTPPGVSVTKVSSAVLELSYDYSKYVAAVKEMLSEGDIILVARYLDPSKHHHSTNFWEVSLDIGAIPIEYDFRENRFALDSSGAIAEYNDRNHRYQTIRVYLTADGLPLTALKALKRTKSG